MSHALAIAVIGALRGTEPVRQHLADQLGLATEELGTELDALVAEGFVIDESDGRLVLQTEEDAFGARALAVASDDRGLVRPVGFVAATESTNLDARAALKRGEGHGWTVVAGEQRHGRGRQGRSWDSTPGAGLALSMILRTRLEVRQRALLCLAAAVGIADALGWEYRIKWPNDVLAPSGRKVAGVLAEADPDEDGVVIGIGINVNRTPPDLPLATSLRDVDGDARPRARLAVDVVHGVLAAAAVTERDPSAMLERWRRRADTLGKTVRVGDAVGDAVDIDELGGLVLRRSDGTRVTVRAGDVEMLGMVGS